MDTVNKYSSLNIAETQHVILFMSTLTVTLAEKPILGKHHRLLTTNGKKGALCSPSVSIFSQRAEESRLMSLMVLLLLRVCQTHVRLFLRSMSIEEDSVFRRK
jgi:hypothetical protein